jgi:hypothetical protein
MKKKPKEQVESASCRIISTSATRTVTTTTLFGGRPVEFVIEHPDDPEQFVEALAEFLWRHRHLGREPKK